MNGLGRFGVPGPFDSLASSRKEFRAEGADNSQGSRNGVERCWCLGNGSAPDLPDLLGTSRIRSAWVEKPLRLTLQRILQLWMERSDAPVHRSRLGEPSSAFSGCCPRLRVK